MALALIIADETTHFSITYSTDIVRRLPKNSVMLMRNTDRFRFVNGSDVGGDVGVKGFDVSDVTTPLHAEVAATGTFTVDTSITEGLHGESALTSSGASVPGVYAESTLTASTILDTETVTIDATVYTFKTTPASAFDVNLGANDAAALDNLKLAINATGVGDGTDYYTGTTVHPTVIASINTDTTQKVVARIIGTASNTEATTDTGGGSSLTWADTTLGGGTGTSVTGVVTTAATVTINATVYTSVTSLAELHGLTAIPYQVLWVTSEAVFLDNLKSAINNTATEGTDYGTGTVAHPTVVATTNTDTVQTIVVKIPGTASNAEVTQDTIANLGWTGADIANGTVAGLAGDTVTIDTVTYTFVDILSEDHATAIANQVHWETNDATALDNLKLAINLGATIGTNYSTSTVVHPTVTATTNAATTQVVAAKTTGLSGNSIVTTETGSTLSWATATLTGGETQSDVLETALHGIIFS